MKDTGRLGRPSTFKTFPNYEMRVQKSEKQKRLEIQGCVFYGQELLDNHELDPCKPCYCGRPNKK